MRGFRKDWLMFLRFRLAASYNSLESKERENTVDAERIRYMRVKENALLCNRFNDVVIERALLSRNKINVKSTVVV